MIRMPISDFAKQVIRHIQSIPKGKVATYKQIAELAGKPHAARGVSWILHSCARAYKLPWHRVLNSQGKIAFSIHASNFRIQKNRLNSEGVTFLDGKRLDLEIYQWKKRARKTKLKAGQPKMFQ